MCLKPPLTAKKLPKIGWKSESKVFIIIIIIIIIIIVIIIIIIWF